MNVKVPCGRGRELAVQYLSRSGMCMRRCRGADIVRVWLSLSRACACTDAVSCFLFLACSLERVRVLCLSCAHVLSLSHAHVLSHGASRLSHTRMLSITCTRALSHIHAITLSRERATHSGPVALARAAPSVLALVSLPARSLLRARSSNSRSRELVLFFSFSFSFSFGIRHCSHPLLLLLSFFVSVAAGAALTRHEYPHTSTVR